MLAENTLLDCTNFFSPNDYEKNDKIMVEETGLMFRLRRIDQTRNLLE